MTEDQIRYMVDRFLGWRLPDRFHPDNGISYTPLLHHPEGGPTGTNLFDAEQATAMVRYMIDGMSGRMEGWTSFYERQPKVGQAIEIEMVDYLHGFWNPDLIATKVRALQGRGVDVRWRPYVCEEPASENRQ